MCAAVRKRVRKLYFKEKLVLLSMSLILTIPCKTSMVIREIKVKSWLHCITEKTTSLDSNGA